MLAVERRNQIGQLITQNKSVLVAGFGEKVYGTPRTIPRGL